MGWRGGVRWALSVAGIVATLLTIAGLVGCRVASQARHMSIVVDGRRLQVVTTALTVRDLLQELNLTLGALDRIEPDVWQHTSAGGTVTITRVSVQEETERRPLPFQQKVIRTEAMAVGEHMLLQLGSIGQEEIVYRLTLEDGIQTERVIARRAILRPAVDEIIAVGIQSQLPSLPIRGTLAYMSGGNAWVMRETSASRRPLTASGDLDGRVFALSPDGSWLLFSRAEPDLPAATLNRLWLIGTSVLNERPQPLHIDGVLYAAWTSDSRGFVFSTGERTGSTPGWKARNDLWRADVRGLAPAGQRTGGEVISAAIAAVLPALSSGVYEWWGTNFALSPDDRFVAFGRPDALGLVDLRSRKETTLLRFAAYRTYGEWIWLPELSWSPDGQFIAATVHGRAASEPSETAEDSSVFDLVILDRMGETVVKVVDEAGMWAAPAWSPRLAAGDDIGASAIAYGVTRNADDSQHSRYDLYVMDRDGSNRRRVFPPPDQPGLVAPDVAWSPDGRGLVVAQDGNLFLLDVRAATWRPLTADGASEQPRWAKD